jgi:3-methyladenine DNA glycosylase/8-oxoguanine DNA glycosylase
MDIVIEELTKTRGIGRWTAELTLLRGMHRPGAFPSDDVGMRRFISQFYFFGEENFNRRGAHLCGSVGSLEGICCILS